MNLEKEKKAIMMSNNKMYLRHYFNYLKKKIFFNKLHSSFLFSDMTSIIKHRHFKLLMELLVIKWLKVYL